MIMNISLAVTSVMLSVFLSVMCGRAWRVTDLFGKPYERIIVVSSFFLSLIVTIIFEIMILMLIGVWAGKMDIRELADSFILKLEAFLCIIEVLPILVCSTIETRHCVSEGRYADHGLWKLGNIVIIFKNFCIDKIKTSKTFFSGNQKSYLKDFISVLFVFLLPGIMLNTYAFEKFRVKKNDQC